LVDGDGIGRLGRNAFAIGQGLLLVASPARMSPTVPPLVDFVPL
jgi:hypothetical protein